MTDIVPEMLENIMADFDQRVQNSPLVSRVEGLLGEGKATYDDANSYSLRVGEMLSESLRKYITPDTLPDGKMYYNIADRILGETMTKDHKLISGVTTQVQQSLNEAGGLGIKALTPPVNNDRIKGLVDKLSNAEKFSDVEWILGEPMVNFSQSIVDDTVELNADFQGKAGLRSVIVRRTDSKPCEWCKNLAGTYTYPEVPAEVFMRHQHCQCTVEYRPGNKRAQDVWTKKWRDETPEDILEMRKKIGISTGIKDADIVKLSKALGADYGNFKDVLNQAPEHIQNMFAKYANDLDIVVKESKGGQYKPYDKRLAFSYDHNNKHPDDIHKFGTLSHEFGHHVDHAGKFPSLNFKEVTKLDEKVVLQDGDPGLGWFKKVPSSSDEFLAAVRKDRDALLARIKDDPDTFWANFKGKNDNTGVQDALDGMFGARSKGLVEWGHGERYYNQVYSNVNHRAFKNRRLPAKLRDAYKELGFDVSSQAKVKKITRDYETASEIWANMFEAETTQFKSLDAMKEYLPNSYEEFIKILGGAE